MSRATSYGEQCSLFQPLHTDVWEKGEVTSVEEGHDVERAIPLRGGIWCAERRCQGYDVGYGEAREGDRRVPGHRPADRGMLVDMAFQEKAGYIARSPARAGWS